MRPGAMTLGSKVSYARAATLDSRCWKTNNAWSYAAAGLNAICTASASQQLKK